MEQTVKKKRSPAFKGDKIRLLAIPVEKDFSLQVCTMYFPNELFQEIKRLHEEKHNPSNSYTHRLPTRQLQEFLHLYLTDVLYVRSPQEDQLGKYWIVALEKISLEFIQFLVCQWVHQTYQVELAEHFTKDLRWQEETIALTIETNSFGTASPSGETYELLTNYLAYRLTAADQPPFEIAGEPVKFVKAKGQGLISWEPFEYKGDYWSYRLKLSLIIVPSERRPYLYVHLGIVRWQSKKIFSRQGKGLNPYVFLKNAFGAQNPSFVQTKLKWGANGPYWDARFDSFLKRYGLNLPDPRKLYEQPGSLLFEGDEYRIAIPYGSHIQSHHLVASGAGMEDRYRFVQQVHERLVRIWDGFAAEMPICKQHRSLGKLAQEGDYLQHLPDCVRIEVYYQNKSWRDELIKTIIEQYELQHVKEDEYRVLGKRINIQAYDLQLWGANRFDVSFGQRNEFREFVRNELTQASPNTVSLFELENKEAFNEKDKVDPKTHLREIFAQSGRLTQFVTPIKDGEKAEQRFKRAVLDTQRQLGLVRKNPERHMASTAHVGIWVHNKSMPIAVALVGAEVRMAIPGVGWMSYSEGLIALSRLKNSKKCDQSLIFELIAQLEVEVEHIILYAKAHNSRYYFDWLQDGKMDGSGIPTAEGGRILPEKWSFVRIRNEENHEAPEWVPYGRKQDEAIDVQRDVWDSLVQGIFQLHQDNDQVFFSIAEKPHTAKTMVLKSTKLEETNKISRKETALEFLVLFHKRLPHEGGNITSVDIVKIAHWLRNEIAVQYNSYTALPLPLHLARKAAEEYISFY